MGGATALALEGAAAAAGADRVPRQALDAVPARRLHDFMHAKVTVADDTTFVGSFNLSRSGETNAENVLEITDPALAERMAGWIDGLRERYPAMSA